MSFLSDLGRSNAIQSVNNLSNTAVQLKGLQNKDEQQGYENAINMEKLGMLKKSAEIQQAEETRKAKLAAEKEADSNRVVDITVHPMFLSLPDEQKSAALKFFSSSGYTDENGRGRKADVLNGVDAIEKNKGLFSGFFAPVIESRKQAVVDSWAALQDAMQSGDEKKISAAADKHKRARMVYQSSSDKFHQHLNKLDEIEAQGQNRRGWKTVQSDESPTGWAYQHPQTDEVIEGAPAPRDYNADTLYRSATLEERIRHNKAEEGKAAGGKSGWKPTQGDRSALDRALTDSYGNMVMGETERMAGMKFTPAQVLGKLTPTEKDNYRKVSKRAWDIYAESGGAVAPSEAVDRARSEITISSSGGGASSPAPPAGFRDSGRTSGGKKVFVSADGKNAWVAP
jgi:hypothetical protein